MENMKFELYPIGYVVRRNGKSYLELDKVYVPALKELETFSHAQIFWWFNKLQDKKYREIKQVEPPYNAPTLGVFASRSPVRPNPLGLTTVEILNVNHDLGLIEITNIDAFDGTPIIDIKAYIPTCDRVKKVVVPNWASDWGEWFPDEGHSLEF